MEELLVQLVVTLDFQCVVRDFSPWQCSSLSWTLNGKSEKWSGNHTELQQQFATLSADVLTHLWSVLKIVSYVCPLANRSRKLIRIEGVMPNLENGQRRAILMWTSFYYFLKKLEYNMLYNAVLVSAVPWSGAPIGVHISAPSWTSPASPTPFHPSRSSRNTELSSLCYIAASHQLSILHTVVYVCRDCACLGQSFRRL